MAVRPDQVKLLLAAELNFTDAHSKSNREFNRADALLTAARRNSSQEEINAAIKQEADMIRSRSRKR